MQSHKLPSEREGTPPPADPMATQAVWATSGRAEVAVVQATEARNRNDLADGLDLARL